MVRNRCERWRVCCCFWLSGFDRAPIDCRATCISTRRGKPIAEKGLGNTTEGSRELFQARAGTAATGKSRNAFVGQLAKAARGPARRPLESPKFRKEGSGRKRPAYEIGRETGS